MQEIFNGLQPVLSLVTKESPILLQSTGERVFVASHNDYHAVVYETRALAPKFSVSLDNDSAKQLLRGFSTGEITVESDKVAVRTATATGTFTVVPNAFSIRSLSSHYTQDNPIILSGEEFSRLFREVSHASNSSSVGDLRFKGFHMTYSPDGIEVMASDANVICVSQSKAAAPSSGTLLLNSEFHSIANAFSSYEKISVSFTDVAVTVEGVRGDSTMRIISTLVKGEPVRYQAVVSRAVASNPNEYLVSREALQEALSKLSYFVGEHARISMKISGEECVLSVGNVKGAAEVKVPFSRVSSTVDSWDIGINLGYLTSFLKSTKESQITVWLGGDKLPILTGYGTTREVITVFLA